jgi:hypothetical protein
MLKRVLAGIAGVTALGALALAPGAADAQASVVVTLLHGIPGPAVDVSVDGSVVVSGLQPGQSADITALAGETITDVEIVEAGTANPVVPTIASLDIPGTGNNTFVINLNVDGDGELTYFANNVQPTSAGEARVEVRNTAQVAPVDIIVGNERPITNLANPNGDDLQVSAGAINNAQVALTGGAPFADLPALQLQPDTQTIVYLVGSVDAATFDFVVQVIDLPASTGGSTTTTTTDPNATTTTTTTDPSATTTTTTSTTTTTTVAAVPTGVSTGSPLDSSTNMTLIAIAGGAILLTGGALVARRRVG